MTSLQSSQELYLALLSGDAMRMALQWFAMPTALSKRVDTEAESKGKRENRLMGHQEELRAHRWTAGGTNTPTQQAPHAPENTSQDSKLKCQLDRPESDSIPQDALSSCDSDGKTLSHEYCSVVYREILEKQGALERPRAHCTHTMIVEVDRGADDSSLPRCALHSACGEQQEPVLQHLQQRPWPCPDKEEHQQRRCVSSLDGYHHRTEFKKFQKQRHQPQKQQHRRSVPFLPSRGGLGRRRNEALLQRVGGGYQLYGPIPWNSLKKTEAQTNTPVCYSCVDKNFII
ncbi:hypothetical protein cyc_01370 [Cyclospora cayetanensis]|uniref:Uncharacterized protein n=1 Tax=Cyclospora cayetanensis TaxID=88456 RepID=A0A1D3CXW5_9EIME|nr:hypothetical protein cyc_01370 [Cyclospora cayetanensis]